MSQRWHEWRNMDTTTCPSHGAVVVLPPVWIPPTGQVPNGGTINGSSLLSGNEIYGTRVILHGYANQYAYVADSVYTPVSNRGLLNEFAFNGGAPVAPGEIGLLTWDLPAWAAVDGIIDKPDRITPTFTPGAGRYQFGGLQTAGAPGWTLASVADPSVLFDDTGVLYTLAAIADLKLVFVGCGVTFALDPVE